MGAGRKSKYISELETKNTKIWKAGIYLRLSSEDENKDISNSIVNQRELLDEFLSKQKDIEVINYYIDDGFSGTNFERPSFKKMFNDVKENKINAIIVKDLSRIGRNYLEVGNYIEQIFPILKIRFIAVTDNIDSFLNPKSICNINLPLKNLMNEEYARDISNKVKAALNSMKRNGQYISGYAPYGYKKDPNDKHHLIIDEETAKNVKLIFNLCLSGLGTTNIAKELNNRNIINPASYRQKSLHQKDISNKFDTLWTSSSIRNILCNPIYCGDMVQGRTRNFNYKNHKRIELPKEEWQIVKNTHDAIIEKEVFEKVQEMRKTRKFNWNRNKTDISIFAGHIKCANCQKNMKKIVQSVKYVNGEKITKYAYVCSTYSDKSKEVCSKHFIKEDDLRLTISRSLKYHLDLLIDFEKTYLKNKNIYCEDNKINVLKNEIKSKESQLDILKKENKTYMKIGN